MTYYMWLETSGQVWHMKVSMTALMGKGRKDVRNDSKNKIVCGWILSYDYLNI